MPRMRGEVDVGGMALTGEELGAVEAAGFDSDENLAISGCRDGACFEFQNFWAAGGVDDGRFHGGHDACVNGGEDEGKGVECWFGPLSCGAGLAVEQVNMERFKVSIFGA